MNIKTFVGIDSSCKDKQGNMMAHEDIYTKVVEAVGLARFVAYLPASEQEIAHALKTDEHLNNIPLQKWDNQRIYVARLLRTVGIKTTSLSDTVCVLKQAARMHVASAPKIAPEHAFVGV